MPVVTSIKPQKSRKRINVYLDGKFGFGIDLENYLKLGIAVGSSYSEKEIIKILDKNEYNKILNKLLNFATFRPRSEKEIFDWFKRKKIHESMFTKLLKRLEHFKLLDDKEFAKWWVSQRKLFRPRSKRMLNYELRAKGIDREIIKDTLREAEIDEVKIAKLLLEKKEHRWRRLNQKNKKQKISQYLFQKGFSWDVINNVLE